MIIIDQFKIVMLIFLVSLGVQATLAYNLPYYDQLNDKEKILALQDPLVAYKIYECSNRAFSEQARLFGSNAHNNEGDAFRHAFWNAIMVKDVGVSWAEKWATAHEEGGNGPDIENRMDLFNNRKGREIGESSSAESYETISKKVYQAVENGQMIKIINEELVTTENPFNTPSNSYSGVATSSIDNEAWPFKLTLIGPDANGLISGLIEWTSLNAIHKIEGSETANGITFAETAYIKKGNAILNCNYYLILDSSSFAGTWDGCGGNYGIISGASSILTKSYSGVAIRSRDNEAWPFRMLVIGPSTDGSINGQIEWTTLNAIHQIKGSETATGVTFTEVAYIKKGNAILNCRYYLNSEGNFYKGTWDGCGDGDYGTITANPS